MVRIEDALAVAGVSLFHRLCDFLITSVNIQSALWQTCLQQQNAKIGIITAHQMSIMKREVECSTYLYASK